MSRTSLSIWILVAGFLIYMVALWMKITHQKHAGFVYYGSNVLLIGGAALLIFSLFWKQKK